MFTLFFFLLMSRYAISVTHTIQRFGDMLKFLLSLLGHEEMISSIALQTRSNKKMNKYLLTPAGRLFTYDQVMTDRTRE
jgi:hypothetical protein